MSKIVWTNGCFDLLHPGHIELFKVGKSLGDKLIVGLDSDERVSEMKGDTRPINTFEDRKAILEAIKYIDLVLEFDSETELENLIQLYKPDILIDGGDWRNANGVGRQYAKAVRFFDRIKGWSSTRIIERCANASW